MSLRRTALLAFFVTALGAPALAQDPTAGMPGGPVIVSVSYSVNVPLASTEETAMAEADTRYRRMLLLRAESECAELLASIATDCAMTSINISTQVNIYPGQPPTLYVTSSVNLQISLRPAPVAP